MRLCSSSKDKSIKIWNSKIGNCLKSILMHSACVTRCIWGGEGIIYSSSEDRSIKGYNSQG